MRISAALSLFWLFTRIVCMEGFLVVHDHQKRHVFGRMIPSSPMHTSLLPFHRQQQQSSSFRWTSLRQRSDDDDHDVPQKNTVSLLPSTRLTRLSRRIRYGAIVCAFWFATLRPAQAKFGYELQETPTYSLRPGMSKTQAQLLEEGTLSMEDVEASASTNTQQQPAAAAPKKKTAAKSSFGYGEEDEEEDDFLMEETTPVAAEPQKTQAASHSTRQSFAAYQQGKSRTLKVKVALCFFVPTYGFMFGREYVRRGRERAYVKKGLEILEVQKAEYFNITSTTNDSDVQDALKGLKKNETKTDDDDEDEDDDEDDEDDDDEEEEDKGPRPSRGKPPRRPRGDGDGGSSGDGSDSGDGKPSAEDLDKLNKMFGRS
jgi:hypothetical protein